MKIISVKKTCLLFLFCFSFCLTGCFKPILDSKYHPSNFIGSKWESSDGTFSFQVVKQEKLVLSDQNSTLYFFATGKCVINGNQEDIYLIETSEIVWIDVYLSKITEDKMLEGPVYESEYFVTCLECKFRNKTNFTAKTIDKSFYFEEGASFNFTRN